MADQLSWSEAAAKAIGDPLATLGALLAGFMPEGPARTAVLVVACLCAALAPFIYKYYLGVLAQGAAPEGSLERQDYDKQRATPEAIPPRGFMSYIFAGGLHCGDPTHATAGDLRWDCAPGELFADFKARAVAAAKAAGERFIIVGALPLDVLRHD
jgi:hypothetical protein